MPLQRNSMAMVQQRRAGFVDRRVRPMSEHGSVQAEEPSGFMDLNPAKIPEAPGRELRVSDDMLNVSRLFGPLCLLKT